MNKRTELKTNHAECARIFPIPYAGTVRDPRVPGKRMAVVDAATDQGAPPLLARVGGWAVTQGGLHCLYNDYHIEKEQLQRDWVRNMRFPKKTWVRVADFKAALRLARSMAELGYI